MDSAQNGAGAGGSQSAAAANAGPGSEAAESAASSSARQQMAENTASSSGGPAAELRCAFYCFFDDVIGRTLAAQEPPEYIKSEQFDAISDYLIPKPQLCGRLLTLRAFGHVVLCWPTCIENNKKYARNALLFSLGVSVAGDRLPAASAACASAARRLAETRAESSHPTSL